MRWRRCSSEEKVRMLRLWHEFGNRTGHAVVSNSTYKTQTDKQTNERTKQTRPFVCLFVSHMDFDTYRLCGRLYTCRSTHRLNWGLWFRYCCSQDRTRRQDNNPLSSSFVPSPPLNPSPFSYPVPLLHPSFPIHLPSFIPNKPGGLEHFVSQETHMHSLLVSVVSVTLPGWYNVGCLRSQKCTVRWRCSTKSHTSIYATSI